MNDIYIAGGDALHGKIRLAPIANEGLLDEISSDTVDFAPNFDASQQEPTRAAGPAALPVAQRCTGLPWALATSIPPHKPGRAWWRP